ncbi:MAG: hypothetical protein ACP5JR_05895 [Thermoplasmata archaeon]
MPKREVNEKEIERILKRVQREFPGNKCLQDIHYYRYILELEWETMTPEEILEDIKKGARRIKKEMKKQISE